MASLPHALDKIPGLGFTVYVDNVSFWSSFESIWERQAVLQAGLNAIQGHLDRICLKAAQLKTKYVAIPPKREWDADIAMSLNLTLGGQCIMPCNSVKILGLPRENTGKGDPWLDSTVKMWTAALNLVRPICCAYEGATEEVARRMVNPGQMRYVEPISDGLAKSFS